MSSDQGHSSGSERSPLLPKRIIEHHEVVGEDQEVSVKPEKSQTMVMYVHLFNDKGELKG